MSLVKASIFHGLDISYYYMKWLPSKRVDHYQVATNEYASKLRQIFKGNLKRKERLRIESLKPNEATADVSPAGLVVIKLGENQQENDRQHKFGGICIERSIFPGAKENDKVFLIPLKQDDTSQEDTTKRMIFGQVASVNSSQIKIKFRNPLVLDVVETKDEIAPKDQSEVVENKEEGDKAIDKLCEKQCSHDSDNDAKDEDDEKKDDEKEDQSSDSDSEGTTEKTPKLDMTKEVTKEDAPEETSSKESEKEHIEENVVKTKVIPANYGIRMEPAEDDNMMDYINCFEDALRKFEKQVCSLPLHKFLLGYYNNYIDSITPKSRVVALNDLPKPKHQQELAIEQSLKRRISLVEGPAGSGKTLVAAHIACNIARVKDYKVLVCSPLQTTVDRLAELIDRVSSVEVIKLPEEHKLKVSGRLAIQMAQGRRGGPSARMRRAKLDDNSDDLQILSYGCHLDKLVDDELYFEFLHKTKSASRSHNRDELHEQSIKQISCCSSWRRQKIEHKLLNRANIVCCTTSQAGSHLIENLSFDMLIIDDVQLLSEPDCFVPLMTKGLKQVTLLSDMRRQIRLARVQRHARKSIASIATSQATKSPVPLAPTLENEMQNYGQSAISSTPLPSNNSTVANGIDASASRNSLNSISFTATIAERRKRAARRKSPAANNNRRGRQRFADTTGLLMETQSDITNIASPSPGLNSGQPTNDIGGLFERWLQVGLPAVDLRHQFRMHETLSAFTNYHYYLNRSNNDPQINQKLTDEIMENFLLDENFDWLPKQNCLTAIFRTETNLLNEKLDKILEKLLTHEKVPASKIGVLFNLQQESFANKWQSKSIKYSDDELIKFGTIENFAGQETDFIILFAGSWDDEKEASQYAELTTCSRIERNFTIDDCILNLALTRARLGLFIVTDYAIGSPLLDAQQNGGPSTSTAQESTTQPINMAKNQEQLCYSWRKLIDYYNVNKLIS